MGITKLKFAIAIGFFALSISSFAQTAPLPVGTEKEFWVWDLTVMPPGFRKTKAVLRAANARSYVFVEEKYWPAAISPDFVEKVSARLEKESAPNAIQPATGIIPFEETTFAPLSSKINPDERLIILFADLGKYKNYEFDGFFNVYDQMKEKDAWSQYAQHSNEANLIYINGPRQSMDYTLGIIAHELHHLLAIHAVPGVEEFQQDSWLSETLAEGAMLLNGYFTDQKLVDRYAENTAKASLVSDSYVQYGPQLLFSSFLIDTLGRHGGIGELTRSGLKGNDAVEALFQNRTGAPISFDAIFSNFITYVFQASLHQEKLPSTWNRQGFTGILIPQIQNNATIDTLPASKEGELLPYSFATYALKEELPEDSLVKVELLSKDSKTKMSDSCASNATILWKPLTSKALAVYAIGCEQKNADDKIPYRLSIFGKPSIFLPSPFRLTF